MTDFGSKSPKWEYLVEVLDPEPEGIIEGAEAFQGQLNDYRLEGLELVTVVWKEELDFLAILKRQISN